MDLKNVDGIIEAALKEDHPRRGRHLREPHPGGFRSKAVLLAKEDGVLAGIGLAWLVFAKIDPKIAFEVDVQDGQEFKERNGPGPRRGQSIALLKGERTALNFLQRLSGIATATRRFVEALDGTKTRILDTRKTTPGLRVLEKYAVKLGGGVNHRIEPVRHGPDQGQPPRDRRQRRRGRPPGPGQGPGGHQDRGRGDQPPRREEPWRPAPT